MKKVSELIWQNEPIGSGDLVKLSEKEMSGKIHNIYRVEKLCEKGIFKMKCCCYIFDLKDEYAKTKHMVC